MPSAQASRSCVSAAACRCSAFPPSPVELNLAEEVIFKGATVQGINGRRMYQTWYQMTALLKANKLDLHPVITDRIAMKDFASGMERLKTGEASKILVYPNGTK